MGMMVLQDRARSLNLTNLSDREMQDILDMLVDPVGIFDAVLTSMQQRCEASKREDDGIELCVVKQDEVLILSDTV